MAATTKATTPSATKVTSGARRTFGVRCPSLGAISARFPIGAGFGGRRVGGRGLQEAVLALITPEPEAGGPRTSALGINGGSGKGVDATTESGGNIGAGRLD